ncbi:restriction endonuclease subunit S [Enterobacter roggenkampii]|uniref:restriction endonuclease subunit S n=1 Tax=Enterobacter roggenkampii TaxID=1812935 RepID=UPI0027EDA45D|nr:restriction endonuclease subunit S [Enterobacter roggenkampii]EMB4295192.1 restriction endonuclease subunit S [Enterobacter roggenkampii]HDT2131873.1 restriction endonuclease subunit S [Enterobacter roggenkampii]HDT2132766.1 restriction endonuclease subunit S [Enterobacter roggenkampii]
MSYNIPTPKGWQLVKLSDLGEVNRGKSKHRPRDADFLYGGKYPFIQTGDVKASGGRINSFNQTYSDEGLKQSRLWPEETMCITIAANIAETGVLQFPACFPDSVIGFIADKTKCDVYFIEYMFRLLKAKIKSQANGSVQDNINLQTLERILFPIPNLADQKKIAKILGVFDDKIIINNRLIETLEQMAQALFKSWFVDFEPVKAKMAALEEGGSQEDATLAAMTAISGKNADALAVFEREHPEQYAELKVTAELFPSAMQDSELGNIPVTWELGKLQDLLVLQRGFDLPSSARKDGEFPLIAASGPNGTHNVAMAKAPGVITGRSGVLGKVYLTLEDYWPLNTTLWVKEFKRATPCYAYELLRLLDMKAFNAGSAVPSLNRNHIHSLSYPLPPMALVNLFESSALLLHQRAHVNLKHSQSLALLRDTLLPKLLSGEITLPEAEQAVSEAENV